MIAEIPSEKHDVVVTEIQWIIRNLYKDIGFSRSDEVRLNLRLGALSDIEDIIAEAEPPL